MNYDDHTTPGQRRGVAMALAQGWALVVQCCAIRAGHPFAEQSLADDIAGLHASGGADLVAGAMGAELAEHIGRDATVELLRSRTEAGSEPLRVLAEALAELVEYDGASASTMMTEAQDRAERERLDEEDTQ